MGVFGRRLSPRQIILCSYLAMILLGAVLLVLPVAKSGEGGASFPDALFTSFSAICVTGLTLFPMGEYWSLFGQIVLMILTQIGGLGFVTLVTMAFVASGKRISLRDRLAIQAQFSQNDIKGMVTLVKGIVRATFIVEGIGAAVLFARFLFLPGISAPRAFFMAVFHAVSAFCNAGFNLMGNGGFGAFVADPVVNVALMLLVAGGGLGFVVWFDVVKILKTKKADRLSFRQCFEKLTLNSKIVLTLTVALWLIGAVFFFGAEFSNPASMGGLGIDGKIWASIFQSVNCRSAGFTTIDPNSLTYSSKFMSIILTFIGGSPTGMAGGVKTTAFGILLISVVSAARGHSEIRVFGRAINLHLLREALTVVTMSLSVIVGAAMVLSFTEMHNGLGHQFIDILYESVAAVSTGGVTLGVTPTLTLLGKITLMICMLFGRLGPITIAMALNSRLSKNQDIVKYPEENIIVG